MDAFERELLRRSPLASAVLEICDHIFDDRLLKEIWQKHRGRCYQDVLCFGDFLRLMRDALIRHGGSAHKLFVDLESRNAAPVDESNFYRKLARMPVELSRALLRECTQRLSGLLAGPGVELPDCVAHFEVIVADGKTIKNAAKRLKPTRGYIGKMLGAKALVALDVRSGMAIAMTDALDGMSNEVPLVPALMPQLHELFSDRAILSIWDRQFDDLRTLAHLSSRPQDAFLVRMKHKNMSFVAESAVRGRDSEGREWVDEIGVLGSGKQARRIRRITLRRNASAGEEDVVLLTNLLDRDRYSAVDWLELYRHRWCIEQVFQQVTETFSLSHLIGCQPQAVLLQFAFCLLLYNVMQVVRVYVADDGRVLTGVVSMHYLFDDARTELSAWAYHTDCDWPRTVRDAVALRAHLRKLLRGVWDPIRYTKSSDRKPRGQPSVGKWLSGGHTSIQRALEGRAKVVRRAKVVTR
jgi:hypothetical protein